MSAAAYDRRQFAAALRDVGLAPGMTVFSHSNIGFFGFPAEGRTPAIAGQTILGAFLDVLGPDGVLAVPTFTYSFAKGEDFDPDRTPSACGVFAEMLRRHPDAVRSADPMFSVAAIGAGAAALTANAPPDCFGEDSFWGRFLRRDGWICNLNCDAGSTFLHYVERRLGVPYRFAKTFRGNVLRNGLARPATAIHFCRDLDRPEDVAAFERFDRRAREAGIVRTARVGRGEIVAMRAAAVLAFLERELPREPRLLTQGGATATPRSETP